MNLQIIQGRIGQIEKKEVGETSLVTFSVATSEKWKDKNGQKQEETTWHNCQSWGSKPIQFFATSAKVTLSQYRDN